MRKDDNGFTLVELVVAVALLALILVPTASFFTNSFKIQSSTAQKTAATRAGQYIVENLKNKNYLKDSLKDNSKNAFGNVIEGIELSKGDKNYKFSDKTKASIKASNENVWNITYNGVKYNVKINIDDGLSAADNSSLTVPESTDCIAKVEIDEDGKISIDSSKYGNISVYKVGGTFKDPIDEESYVATNPLIVLKQDYIASGEKATLWIKNNGYYDSDNNKQKTIQIIKKFADMLYVYKEGDDFAIKMGQPGDGASAAQTKCEGLFVGEEESTAKKEDTSEILLNASIVITNANDEKIRDTFEFSFPVDYDF